MNPNRFNLQTEYNNLLTYLHTLDTTQHIKAIEYELTLEWLDEWCEYNGITPRHRT